MLFIKQMARTYSSCETKTLCNSLHEVNSGPEHAVMTNVLKVAAEV